MKHLLVSFLVLVAGTTTARGQSENWANKIFLTNMGKTSHDFGNVPRGAQLYHKFPITNIYAVPLEVMSVRTSCGCVAAKASQVILQPRETGFLEVNMDARRFTGPKTISIYVTVGPEYVSTATLQVSAHSRADIVFNPSQVNFGVVAGGQKAVQNIDVEYAGNLDWRITEVIKNSVPCEGAFEEIYRKPGQVGYRIKVSLNESVPSGPFKYELLLKTNDPTSPLVPVLVEGTVQSPLSVVPPALSMGQLKLGESVTKRVMVRGNKPFQILKVEGLGDDIQLESLPKGASAIQTVTLKYQPTRVGDVNRKVQIKTDLGKEQPVTLTVEGSATQ